MPLLSIANIQGGSEEVRGGYELRARESIVIAARQIIAIVHIEFLTGAVVAALVLVF